MDDQETNDVLNQDTKEVENEELVQEAPQEVQNTQEQASQTKSSNKKLFIAIGCIVFIVIALVCGGFLTLFGATFLAIDPSEAFKDARNVRREQDVDALTAGLRQYILRDLNGDISEIASVENCNLDQGLAVIDPNDGISPNEGLPIDSLSVCISDYIAGIPSSVEGSSYRWGVDNAEYPTMIFVGVDSMDSVGGEPVNDYYNVIELYSY